MNSPADSGENPDMTRPSSSTKFKERQTLRSRRTKLIIFKVFFSVIFVSSWSFVYWDPKTASVTTLL
ncbi:hypothetical protein FRB90_001439, partial [Tulasnella sp. 427]